jgi:hypothetical protein
MYLSYYRSFLPNVIQWRHRSHLSARLCLTGTYATSSEGPAKACEAYVFTVSCTAFFQTLQYFPFRRDRHTSNLPWSIMIATFIIWTFQLKGDVKNHCLFQYLRVAFFLSLTSSPLSNSSFSSTTLSLSNQNKLIFFFYLNYFSTPTSGGVI